MRGHDPAATTADEPTHPTPLRKLTDIDPDTLYLVAEVAPVAKLTAKRLRALLIANGIPVTRLGHRSIRVRGSVILDLLTSEEPTAGPPALGPGARTTEYHDPIRRRTSAAS